MDNRIEEIKQLVTKSSYTESELEYIEYNSLEWLRYLLKRDEDSHHLIRHYTEKRDELMANAGKLENDLAKERFELQQSREENERLQTENTHLRGLYERERAIADSEEKRRKEAEKECKRLRGELESAIEQAKMFKRERNDYVAENTSLYGKIEQVKAELDNYRRVLMTYTDNYIDCPNCGRLWSDKGRYARDILSRYKEKGDNQYEQGD